jgi:ClpX C4-type zinc finger
MQHKLSPRLHDVATGFGQFHEPGGGFACQGYLDRCVKLGLTVKDTLTRTFAMTLKSKLSNAASRLPWARRKGLAPTLYCSFCSKSQHHVAQLIAGPSIFICNECVAICVSLVEEAERKAQSGESSPVPPPNESSAPEGNDSFVGEGHMIGDIESMPTERLLRWLKFQEKLFEQSRAGLQDAVDTLRAREVSWAVIGDALGVSRQAAWDRFS